MTYLEMALRAVPVSYVTPPTVPGREAARPCLRCHGECEEGELFCNEECFRVWKVERERRRKAIKKYEINEERHIGREATAPIHPPPSHEINERSPRGEGD